LGVGGNVKQKYKGAAMQPVGYSKQVNNGVKKKKCFAQETIRSKAAAALAWLCTCWVICNLAESVFYLNI